MTFHVPEKFRIVKGLMATSAKDGNNGAFMLSLPYFLQLFVVATDNDDWEHVSVSLHDRCPTWDEMCHVKALFWDAEDCVLQYHPPEADYVNNHRFCLHLWRPVGFEIPRPPAWMVGIKGVRIV
jgi:hypothetical protein